MSSGNCFLFDWLTVSFPALGFADVQGLLCMDHKTWLEEKSGSRLRYGHRVSYDGISIHYTDEDDTRHNQGACLEMSGQGCRDFETFGDGDWCALFDWIARAVGKITRLDIAYDDFTGVLDLPLIAELARRGQFTSRLQRMQCYYDWCNHTDRDHCALTVMHGSRQSDCCIRIYDKREERKAYEYEHWVRCEIQLRAGCGQGFLDRYMEVGDLGDTFRGVLTNYLNYRCYPGCLDPVAMRQVPVAPFWSRFVDQAAALRVHSVRGVEYNRDRLAAHIDRNHNAIKTEILAGGLRAFVENAFGHTEPLPARYQSIIQGLDNGDQILDVLRRSPVDQVQNALDSA